MLTDRIGSRLERTVTFSDGDLIVAEGDASHEMFVILQGSVRVSHRGSAATTQLAVLNRGDFFGEMSVLESEPRDADVHAIGSVRLLAIGQGGLLARLRRDPTFALEMLHQLSGRIRTMNARVEALTPPFEA